jgi:hypothetical protein
LPVAVLLLIAAVRALSRLCATTANAAEGMLIHAKALGMIRLAALDSTATQATLVLIIVKEMKLTGAAMEYLILPGRSANCLIQIIMLIALNQHQNALGKNMPQETPMAIATTPVAALMTR